MIAMVEMDMTQLSANGDVAIPKDIREELKLKKGEKLLAMSIENTIILRKITTNKERMKLKKLLKKTRFKAQKIGFTEKEIDWMIHSQRAGN